MMDARMFLADARWASLRLKEVERLIESGGEDWRPSRGPSASIAPDPTGSEAMRRLSAVEALLVEKESLLEQIAEASAVVKGVGKGLGFDHMLVLGCYYLDCMKWEEVSEVMGLTVRRCIGLRDVALEWVDSVGFAHAKEGTGIA